MRGVSSPRDRCSFRCCNPLSEFAPMSFSEEIRSIENPLKRGSPLPWLLLAITIIVGATMAIVSHSRIIDEKLRTARALQENDAVMARLRGVVAENARLLEEADAAKAKRGE